MAERREAGAGGPVAMPPVGHQAGLRGADLTDGLVAGAPAAERGQVGGGGGEGLGG